MEIISKYFPELTSLQKEQFSSLLPLYRDWNAKINVVSRKDIDHLYERHVLHSLGIAKINFFTGMSEAAIRATKDHLGGMGERYNDYPMMMNAVKESVTQVVAEQMGIFGSTGQAANL